MTVRLYEWDKTETGWAWIEITANKVVNLKLRSEDNLIQINNDNEAYVDLQLEDWITPSDDFPVGVTTGRVLKTDWRPASWTLTVSKTTSWDYHMYLYGDDWEIYADNGTGTWVTLWDTTAYFETESEYADLPASKTTDHNLYIIVDYHRLLEYEELVALETTSAILGELNAHPEEYLNKYSAENHIYNGSVYYDALTSDGTFAWLLFLPEASSGVYGCVEYRAENGWDVIIHAS